MLRNYLLISWRSLLKSKSFSLINIVGLSLSMSVCLLIILLIYNHYQYDTFHPQGDRTYRILSHRVGEKNSVFESGYATSVLRFREALEGNYAGVEIMTNLNHQLRGELRSESRIFNLERSLFADENFFKVFGFQLQEGDPLTALTSPNSIVLAAELAEKLFPEGDAVGQLVTFREEKSFKVTGVVAPSTGLTHVKFDALASFSSLPQLAEEGMVNEEYDSWNNIWLNYNYLVLTDPSQAPEIEQAINLIANENMVYEEGDTRFEFSLQAMSEIVPGKLLANEIGFAMPFFFLAFFALLAFVVMVTASINYANLSIARTLTRVKEIGVRKSSGAGSWQIAQQFLVESVLMSILSLVLAIIFYKYLIDAFNEMWLFSQIGITLVDEPSAYIYFMVFALLLGLVTGVAPSFYASKMDAVSTLKGSLGRIAKSGLGVRRLKNVMMGVQFMLASVLLVTLFVIRDQAHYLTNADYGFEEDQMYFMSLQENDPRKVYSEFSQIAGIERIAFTTHHTATGRTYGESYRLNEEDEPLTIYHFGVDTAYRSTMGITLIAGRDFSEESQTGEEKHVIINELAANRLGFEDPVAAVGEWLYQEESNQLEIIGVVKDYHHETMMSSLKPLMLRSLPEDFHYAYFKINSPQPGTVVKQIEEKWSKFDPLREYQGGFLSQEMDQFYQFMYDLGGILGLIAVLAMSITGLGLIGMVNMHVQAHVKALGIRKVLGAQFGDLFFTISKGFLKLIGLSLLLGIPAAIALNNLWIQNMAQRVSVSFLNVAPGVVVLVILSIAIILWQVVRVLAKNPVLSLRSE